MFLTIILTSKKLQDAIFFLKYLECSLLKANIKFLSHKILKTTKTKTILKSPHVNKKAKRSFFFYSYKSHFKIKLLNKPIGLLLLLKSSKFLLNTKMKIAINNIRCENHYTLNLKTIQLLGENCFKKKLF